MHRLDDDFLGGLADSAGIPGDHADFFLSIEVPHDSPYVDISAIADVHLDRNYDSVAPEHLQKRFRERYGHLHRTLAGNPHSHLAVVAGDLLCQLPAVGAAATDRYRRLVLPTLEGIDRDGILVVPGNTDAYTEPGGSSPYEAEIASKLGAAPPASTGTGCPVVSLMRVISDQRDDDVPLAYVAVIGFDSNDAAHRGLVGRDLGLIGTNQLDAARRLVTTLRDGPARTAPLYVVAVMHHGLLPRGGLADDLTLNDRWTEDARRELFGSDADLTCQALPTRCIANEAVASTLNGMTSNGASVLAQLQRLRTSLILHADMRHRAITTLLRTPVELGVRGSDVALVPLASFDPDSQTAGMVRIRLNVERGEAEVGYKFDRGSYGENAPPLQTITPLHSASRISPAERRLLGEVRSTLADQPASGGVEELTSHLTATWNDQGYATLCMPDGRASGLSSERSLTYYLFLLVREGPNGGYELLLSRHTPLRPSALGYWETLLLPAFTRVQDLLQRLRDDVLRQVVGKAVDMEKAKSAQTFERAVSDLIKAAESDEKPLWSDKLHEVASTDFVKISPTTGLVTTYHYRLVTLLNFVADPSTALGSHDTATQERTVVSWLDELPRIARPGEQHTGSASIPLEAIMAGGAGLRWEPAADPDDLAIDDDFNQARELPPGGVWFPLPETDETAGPWTDCPSIVTRNADVMTWVEHELLRQRNADGSLPPHLVMGRFQEKFGFTRHGSPFPFKADAPDTDHPPAASTTQALRRVTFLKGYDLSDEHPYAEPLAIKRVILERRTIHVGIDGWPRDVIQVFEASQLPTSPGSLSLLELGTPLGVLRPVQRYVLTGGIVRAKAVNEFLDEELASDPWGFVRASWGGLPELMSLTPPIVEQMWPADTDGESRGEGEFILCDGNHRVVQRVWHSRGRMAAVAVVGEPVQPYYAHAFSRYEWGLTAKNQLNTSPPVEFTHAAREIPSELAEELAKTQPMKLFHRRYYRDLETGFGSMGRQGGR